MESSSFENLQWARVRLRPFVHSLFPSGQIWLRDWPWLVMKISGGWIFLQNTATGHQLEVPATDVLGFDQESGILDIRRRPWITAMDAKLKSCRWWPSWRNAVAGVLH
jgi:hypothetical protein